MSTRLTNPMFLIFQIIILVISVYRVRTKVRTVLQDIKLNTGTRYLNDFSFKKKKKKKIILTTSSVTQADSQQNSALDWISVWHWSWLTPGMLWWRFSFSNLRTAWSASSWGWYTYSDFFFFFFCSGSETEWSQLQTLVSNLSSVMLSLTQLWICPPIFLLDTVAKKLQMPPLIWTVGNKQPQKNFCSAHCGGRFVTFCGQVRYKYK